MDRNSSTQLYSAMGIAGQAGCLTVLLAVGSLLIGLLIDRALGIRWASLVCVLTSVPISLIVTLRITQRLVARIIPPDKPKSDSSDPAGERRGEDEE